MSSPRGRRPIQSAVIVALAAAAVAIAIIVTRGDGSASSAPRAADGTATARVAHAAATSAAPAQPARARPLRTVRRVYGHGPSAVAIVRPEGINGPLPGVLFLHGWGYQRPGDYGSWIRHLARAGNVVIVPKYQNNAYSDPATVRPAMLAGLRTALRRVQLKRRTLVVAGHSAGAAMAGDYAAIARSEGLPRPRAVFAVYPGRRIIGTPGIPAADPAQIPASTRLLVLAGARDVVVGQQPARDLYAAATSIPASRRRFILVEDRRVSDHLAPLGTSEVVRRNFWRRLDRLIRAARR